MVTVEAAPARLEKKSSGRYRSLDGLRGIAALVVAICHTLLIQPGLMNAYALPASIEPGTLHWWLSFSPLHLGWAGSEMVYIFFVLSGFVLTVPFMKKPPARKWIIYYPKRLIRLYVPVWGAVAFSVLLMTIFPRNFSPTDSPALVFQLSRLNMDQVINELLLWPTPGFSNNVLWTLKLEVMFSLLLPLVVLFSMVAPKLNLLKAILLFVPVFVFSTGGPDIKFFLPMFALGSIMAVERDRLKQFGAWISNGQLGGAAWAGLALVTLVLLNSNWNLLAYTMDSEKLAAFLPTARALILVGACLAMFISIEGPWRRWLDTPVLQWLGSRSFSLYLVHWPIIVTVAVVLGGQPSLGLSLAVALPVVLLATEVFYRLVENPVKMLCRLVEKAGMGGTKPKPHLLGVEPLPAID
jgi:peptidoglycan/LPS O-acetylase OafA/YrhL